jgi:hypothetical protein
MSSLSQVLNEQELATLQAQAFLLLQAGRFHEGYQLFKALCKLEPESDRLLVGLAVCALKAGDAEVAVTLCKQLIEQTPLREEPQTWLCYSRALWAQNQPDLARKAYAKFIQLKQLQQPLEADA